MTSQMFNKCLSIGNEIDTFLILLIIIAFVVFYGTIDASFMINLNK